MQSLLASIIAFDPHIFIKSSPLRLVGDTIKLIVKSSRSERKPSFPMMLEGSRPIGTLIALNGPSESPPY